MAEAVLAHLARYLQFGCTHSLECSMNHPQKALAHRAHRGSNIITAMKALVLVAAVWGVVYPTLLWSLERLLQL